jgi:putative DNA primase/helicase
VVQDLLALGGWPGIPSLTVVSRCPLLGQDGRLRTHPGYDPASKSYITDGPFPEWDGDAGSAVRFLAEELLGDFPFVGEADLAGALALTVLPFVRPAIDGPTPLHLVDAPVQGSGKSLLVRACLWPALGSTAAATTATRDEEEWRKKITTALLEGRPAVFLDNLSKKLDSDSLAAVITSTEWSDRALGQMKAVNVPVRCVWAATANNAELSRDLARRTAYVRLDAQVERPEDRTGFRHPDIEAWCRNERPRLVSAVCKIVGDWAAAGRPLWTGAKIGSFEAWCAVVGGILTNAGVDGFLGNLSAMRTAVSDGEEQAWGALYADWYATWGSEPVAAAALHEKALEIEGLLSILGDAGPQSQKIRLGKALRHRVGVVVRGLKPVTAGSHQNAQRYSLVPVTNTEKHSPHSPLNLTLIDTSLSIGECQGAHSPNPNLGSVEPGQHGVDKQNPNGTLTEPASGSVSQVDSECSECSHARTRARDGHGSAVSHSEQNGARPSPTSPGMGAVEPETGSVRIEGTTSPTSQVQTEEEVW